MLEWAAISAKVLPQVLKYAKDRGKSLAEKSADAALRNTYHHLLPDATIAAVNEAFCRRFSVELESSDLQTFTAAQTQDDLAAFLANPTVQDIIRAPLDGRSTIDSRLLAAIWTAMGLTTLSPDFRWQLVAKRHLDSLIDQGLAKGDLRPVFAKLAEIAEGQRQDRAIVPGFDTAAYFRRANQDYGNLKLYQLHTTSADDVVKLRDIFVPQTVRESLPPSDLAHAQRERLRQRDRRADGSQPASAWPETRDRDDPEEFQSRYLSLPLRPILEVASDPGVSKAVILGGPGSGKSSLLQYLTLEAAIAADRPIPLLIELGKYARDATKPRSILEFLAGGEFALFHLNRHDLDAALKDTRACLLLDGLDEIFDPPRYEAVVAEIKRLTVAYPNARILVTTRIVGYREQPLADAGFRHFTLQDFDARQIEDFLARWLRLANLPEHEKRSRHARLQRAVRESAAIRELARNPLLLTMLVLVNRTQEIPRERVRAYSVISELLLHHWDFERGLAPDDPDLRPDAIGLEEKLTMARLVAFEMQQAPEGLAGNLIAREHLEEILTDYLKGVTGAPHPKRLARRIIDRLHSRDAILSFAGADSYRFVHRTFLEFFCASEFDRQAVKLDRGFAWLMEQTVRAHWRDTSWHEVIRLLAGLSGETKTARMVEFLLAQDTYRARGSNIILAAQCLTELRQFTALPQLAELRRALSMLYDFEIVRGPGGDPVHEDDEKREFEVRRQSVALHAALADTPEAGRQILAFLATLSRSWWVRQAALEELARGWPSEPDTLRILKSCAASDDDEDVRRSAVQELARGWRSDPRALRILELRFESDEDNGVRQAAVQQVARGWPSDPETSPWLKALAQSDKDSEVRQTAVQELARGWHSDPGTLAWLKSQAESDEHRDVRQAALQELARGWHSDPETLRILMSYAESDGEHDVRRTALKELARGWPSNVDTLRILKSIAESNWYNMLPAVAIEELARGWPSHPDTLTILKSRAQSTGDWSVRQAALQQLARGWPSDPDTLGILKSSAASAEDAWVRQTALEELVRGWPSNPDTLCILKSRAEVDADNFVRQAPVQEVARGWQSHPDTLRWLTSLAESDMDSGVRQVALQEVARGWHSRSGTMPWLKSRVESDEDDDVRRAALQEVARGWRSEPDTLTWLKSLAESNGDKALRSTAVQELARGWPFDPDTLPWFKSHAQSDEDSGVRGAAVVELARRWPSDPDTVRILQSRAQSDEDSFVRMQAFQELAHGWPTDPDTVRILQFRAENDDHPFVQSSARYLLDRLGHADTQET